MKLTLYFIREVQEQTALDVTLQYFSAFPYGLGFRPLSIHWQVAMSQSTTTGSSPHDVHRAVSAQIQFYSPIDQTSDHTVWSSSPILVPWGQRIQGRQRVNVPWFPANASKNTRILRVETLCIFQDSTNVSTSWVVAVTFAFRKPDFGAACPTLRHLHGIRDDSDDESSPCKSFENIATTSFQGGEGIGDA